jgi:SHS2 domain-containing protein
MPERRIDYEKLQRKADTGISVKAPSLERLYVNAGLALTDLMARLESIDEKERRQVKVSSESPPKLLTKWLNEIIRLFKEDKFVARRIVFDKFDGKTIQATLRGEAHDPLRHGLAIELKPIAVHQLELGDSPVPEPHFYVRIFWAS